MSTLPTAILQNIYHEVAREHVNRSALSFQRERSLSSNSQGEPLLSDHSPNFYSSPDLPGRTSAKATTATIVEEEDSADGLDAFNEIEKRIQIDNAHSQAIKKEPTLLSPILKGKPSSPVPGYTNDVNNRYNPKSQPRAAKSSLKSMGELNSKTFERSMSVPMQKVTFVFEKGDESGKITPTEPAEEQSSSSKAAKAVKVETEKRPRSSSTVAVKTKESPRKSRAVNQSGFVKPKKKSNFFYSFADQEGRSEDSLIREKNTKSLATGEDIIGSSSIETKESVEAVPKKVSLIQTYDLYKRKEQFGGVDEAGFDPDGLFRARADSDPSPRLLGVTQMLPEKKIEIEEDHFPENQLKNTLKAKENEQKDKKKIEIAPVNTGTLPKTKPDNKSSRDSPRPQQPQPKVKTQKSKLEIFKQQRGFSLADHLFEVSPRNAAKTQSKSTISSPMNTTITPKPTTPSNKTPIASKQLTPVSATTTKITFPDKSKPSSTELSRKSSKQTATQHSPPEEKKGRSSPSPAKKLVTSKTQQYSTIYAPKIHRKNSDNSPTSANKPEPSPPLNGRRSENEFISGRTSPAKSIDGPKEANLESFLDAKHVDGELQEYGETLGGKPNSYVELDPGYLEPFLAKAPVERVGTPHRIYMKIIDKILQEPDSPTGPSQTPVKSVYANGTPSNYPKSVKGSQKINLNMNSDHSPTAKSSQKSTVGGYSDKKRSIPVALDDNNAKGSGSSLYNVYMPHSPATRNITPKNEPKSTTNKETVSTPNKLQPSFDRKGLNATPGAKDKSPREYHAPWEYNHPSSLYKKLGTIGGAETIANSPTIYSQQVTKTSYSSAQKSSGSYIQTAIGRKKPTMLQEFSKISSFDNTPSPRPGERLTPKTNQSGRSDLTDSQQKQNSYMSNPRYSPIHRASPIGNIGKASPVNLPRDSPQKKYFLSQDKTLAQSAQSKVSSQYGNRKPSKGM